MNNIHISLSALSVYKISPFCTYPVIYNLKGEIIPSIAHA